MDRKITVILIAVIILVFLISGGPKSKYIQSAIPPGMVLVKGEGNIPSFLISRNPCSNFEYAVYKDWLTKVYQDFPEIGRNAEIKTSDTVILWNDPLVSTYMGHPAFGAYPVVGISWYQAMDFCRWKNDRVNESVFLELSKINPEDIRNNVVNENSFNTEAYLAKQYEFSIPKGKRYDTLFYRSNGQSYMSYNYVEKIKQQPEFLYGYRLPSEQEWELAMAQHVFSQVPENITVGRYNDVWATKEVNLSKMSKGYPSSLIQFWKDSMNMDKTADWLFDIYGSERKSYKGVLELLNNNGMIENPNFVLCMDQYGELQEKDSLGMLRFRIMSWLPGGYPLIACNYGLKRFYESALVNGHVDERYKLAALKAYNAFGRDTLRKTGRGIKYELEFDVDGKPYRFNLPYDFVSVEDDMAAIKTNDYGYFIIRENFKKVNQRVVRRSNWRSSRNESQGSNQVSFRYMVPWPGTDPKIKYYW